MRSAISLDRSPPTGFRRPSAAAPAPAAPAAGRGGLTLKATMSAGFATRPTKACVICAPLMEAPFSCSTVSRTSGSAGAAPAPSSWRARRSSTAATAAARSLSRSSSEPQSPGHGSRASSIGRTDCRGSGVTRLWVPFTSRRKQCFVFCSPSFSVVATVEPAWSTRTWDTEDRCSITGMLSCSWPHTARSIHFGSRSSQRLFLAPA